MRRINTYRHTMYIEGKPVQPGEPYDDGAGELQAIEDVVLDAGNVPENPPLRLRNARGNTAKPPRKY